MEFQCRSDRRATQLILQDFAGTMMKHFGDAQQFILNNPTTAPLVQA
jgi:hypothetical protein